MSPIRLMIVDDHPVVRDGLRGMLAGDPDLEVVGDALRPSSPGKGGQQGAFFDLYFALTSESGLWTFDEMRSWQVAAGLTPRKSISLVPGGGFALQVAERVDS